MLAASPPDVRGMLAASPSDVHGMLAARCSDFNSNSIEWSDVLLDCGYICFG